MKTPTMTVQECEAALGPRGHLQVTKENRPLVRKWLNAQGFPSLFTGGLSYVELKLAYNQTDGAGLEAMRKKLASAQDDLPADYGQSPDDVAPAKGANVAAGNGQDVNVQDVANMLTTLFNQQKKTPAIDFETVRQIVRDEVQGLKPRPVEVRVNEAAGVMIEERVNPIFDRVLKLVANGANVLLVGPAGCGKSHLCSQISRALKTDFGAIHGTAGASESALTGWLLPAEGGRFEYVPSRFVELYEKGNSLFCFDEMDAFDPNMLMVANGATSNGHIHIAHRRDKPMTPRGEKVYLMATANTYGTGANPIYTARAALDGATNDRWLIVTMDYDRDLETDIGTAAGLTADEMAQIWSLRDKVRNAGLRRIVSTRAFQKAAHSKASGDKWATTMATLTEGWTKDEKAKAGIQ